MNKWFAVVLPVLVAVSLPFSSDAKPSDEKESEDNLAKLTIKHDLSDAFDDAKIKFIGIRGNKAVTLEMKNGETAQIPAGNYDKTFYRIESQESAIVSVLSFTGTEPLVIEKGKPNTVILKKPETFKIRVYQRQSYNNKGTSISIYHETHPENGMCIDTIQTYRDKLTSIRLPVPYVTIMKGDEVLSEGNMQYG